MGVAASLSFYGPTFQQTGWPIAADDFHQRHFPGQFFPVQVSHVVKVAFFPDYRIVKLILKAY